MRECEMSFGVFTIEKLFENNYILSVHNDKGEMLCKKDMSLRDLDTLACLIKAYVRTEKKWRKGGKR